ARPAPARAASARDQGTRVGDGAAPASVEVAASPGGPSSAEAMTTEVASREGASLEAASLDGTSLEGAPLEATPDATTTSEVTPPEATSATVAEALETPGDDPDPIGGLAEAPSTPAPAPAAGGEGAAGAIEPPA